MNRKERLEQLERYAVDLSQLQAAGSQMNPPINFIRYLDISDEETLDSLVSLRGLTGRVAYKYAESLDNSQVAEMCLDLPGAYRLYGPNDRPVDQKGLRDEIQAMCEQPWNPTARSGIDHPRIALGNHLEKVVDVELWRVIENGSLPVMNMMGAIVPANSSDLAELLGPVKSPHAIDEKPLTTRERNTLLLIIAALAKGAKINVDKEHYAAGKKIAELGQQIGVTLKPDTVAEKLKLVYSAVADKQNGLSDPN